MNNRIEVAIVEGISSENGDFLLIPESDIPDLIPITEMPLIDITDIVRDFGIIPNIKDEHFGKVFANGNRFELILVSH